MRALPLVVVVVLLAMACDDGCDCCKSCPGGGAVDILPGGADTPEPAPDTAADTPDDLPLCEGSAAWCACMAAKDGDEKYTVYCDCMDSPSVPGGDNATYCGCCVFAYDESFEEYEEEWQYLVAGTCEPQGYEPPCQFD